MGRLYRAARWFNGLTDRDRMALLLLLIPLLFMALALAGCATGGATRRAPMPGTDPLAPLCIGRVCR